MTLDPNDPASPAAGVAPEPMPPVSAGHADVGGVPPAGGGPVPDARNGASGDGGAREQAGEVAHAAAGEAANVKDTALAATHDVAAEAKSQVSAVVGETKQQIGDLVQQARSELQQQAHSQGQQAAGALSTLSDRLQALVDGRPEEAGPLVGVVSEAQDKVRAYADRIGDAGPQGVLDDLTSFARRRPGLFLLGAGIAGFAIGRVVKAGTGDDGAPSGNGAHAATGLPAPAPATRVVPPAAAPSATLREPGGFA